MRRMLLLAAVIVGLAVPAVADEPSLIAVNISFQLPKCDDKDDDSSLDIRLSKDGDIIAEALRVGRRTTFRDPSTAGPFPLVLKKAIAKSAYTGSVVTLHLNTKGNDTFCSRATVEALFSDDTKVTFASCHLFKISESNRDISILNQNCP